MVSWAPRLPPAVSGSGVRCGRVCWARVSAVPSPSLLGCRVVFFALLFFLLFFFFFFSGLCGPCPSIPFFFFSGWAAGSRFFFPFRCPSSPWAAVTGLVLPVLGGWSPCASVGVLSSVPSRGGFGRLWWCWRAVWRLWAVFVPFPPPPSFFSGGGGGLACSSLCLPWAGARTGLHSVLSSGLLSSVAFCVAAFRPHGSGGLCTRWARRPFLPGLVLALPAGRLRQAGACGFGLGGWGCSCPFPSAVPAVFFWVVRHRCRLERCGPVCGLRCWCVACWRGAFQGVRWLASVSPSGWGQLCRAVPLCAASRRVVLWCVALWRAVVRCAVVSRGAAVGQWRSAWPVSWCGVRAGVWPAGGWGVRLGVGGSLGPRCGGLGVPLGLVGRIGLRKFC